MNKNELEVIFFEVNQAYTVIDCVKCEFDLQKVTDIVTEKFIEDDEDEDVCIQVKLRYSSYPLTLQLVQH